MAHSIVKAIRGKHEAESVEHQYGTSISLKHSSARTGRFIVYQNDESSDGGTSSSIHREIGMLR